MAGQPVLQRRDEDGDDKHRKRIDQCPRTRRATTTGNGESDQADEGRQRQLHERELCGLREQEHGNGRQQRHTGGPHQLGDGRLHILWTDASSGHEARRHAEREPVRDSKPDCDSPDDPDDVRMGPARLGQRCQGREEANRYVESGRIGLLTKLHDGPVAYRRLNTGRIRHGAIMPLPPTAPGAASNGTAAPGSTNIDNSHRYTPRTKTCGPLALTDA
jgi:hypothetical protein